MEAISPPVAHDDAVLAERIAASITDTPQEAQQVIQEAQEHVEAVLALPEVAAAVRRVALALLECEELAGKQVADIVNEEVFNGD